MMRRSSRAHTCISIHIHTRFVCRRVIKDSRTESESHYHIYKRYFGFLCYNALFVFIVTTSIMETVGPCPCPRVAFGSAMHPPSASFLCDGCAEAEREAPHTHSIPTTHDR